MISLKKWLLILIGSFTWSLTMVKSGLLNKYGIGFWGANGHDGVWHIALAESLLKGSLENPVFSGFKIQNYHIGFDLLLAVLHKVTTIPVLNLYFQVLPPLLAIMLGIGTYKLVKSIANSDSAAFWSIFFVYFGGSFGYFVGKGESAFWSQQAISTLVNPPFALSLIMLVFGLLSLIKYDRKQNWLNYTLTILFFGLLAAVKIYASVVVLFGLSIVSAYKLISEKNIKFLYILLGSMIVSLLVYFPLNKNSQNILVWQPFWFLETMMATSDRVGWEKFYSAMSTYKSGHMYVKAISAYSVAMLIFLVGNMGTRIISVAAYFKWIFNYRKISWKELFFISTFVIGVIIPMFVVQQGTPWNTIQFLYYSLFVSSITSGLVVASYLKAVRNKVLVYILASFLVLLTVPTTTESLAKVYIPDRPPAALPKDELVALRFLSNLAPGNVLTFPFDQEAANAAVANPPRPLYLYVSTSYVAAFSKNNVFLEDEVNLDITGYDWEQRRVETLNWYKQNDQKKALQFLEDNNIKYIYWLKGQRALLGEGQLGLTNIFENGSVTIYKVD